MVGRGGDRSEIGVDSDGRFKNDGNDLTDLVSIEDLNRETILRTIHSHNDLRRALGQRGRLPENDFLTTHM